MSNERSNVEPTFRPHLFWREMEEVVGALKTKSCLSVSEFFLFSGNSRGNSQKSAAGAFSLFRFFWASKRNEKPSRLERKFVEKK